MKHTVRKRPEGRWQCTGCRAAFMSEESARASKFTCPRVPLPHGPVREHIIYPTWGRDQSCASWGCPDPDPTHDFHGPGLYCDDTACPCVRHACDCDVCEMRVRAPGLNVLRDDHEGSAKRLLSSYDQVECK